MLWLECRTSKNISILIAVCYQPPGLDVQSKQHYCDSFCSALTLLSNTHLIEVVGDFNDPSPQRPLHRQSSLSRVLSSFGLQHLINEPTCQENILDWFLTNKPEVIVNSGVLPPLTSLDHCLIFAEVLYTLKSPSPQHVNL